MAEPEKAIETYNPRYFSIFLPIIVFAKCKYNSDRNYMVRYASKDL